MCSSTAAREPLCSYYGTPIDSTFKRGVAYRKNRHGVEACHISRWRMKSIGRNPTSHGDGNSGNSGHHTTLRGDELSSGISGGNSDENSDENGGEKNRGDSSKGMVVTSIYGKNYPTGRTQKTRAAVQLISGSKAGMGIHIFI